MFSKYFILIFSSDPDKLMKFYQNVLGLKLTKKLDIPNDYGYEFEISKGYGLWIGKHSEVKGKNKDKFRHIFNLYPDSVTKWYNKVKGIKGVTIISKPQLTPFATKKNPTYVSTFLDPENNCWQFIGPK